MPMTRAAEKKAAARSDDSKDESKSAGSKHEIEDEKSSEPKRVKIEDDHVHQAIEDKIPSPTEAYGNGHAILQPKSEPTIIKEENRDIEGQDRKRGTAEKQGERQGAVPSNILEKGIIYFFFRGRVGIDEPSDINEIKRSYMILRPLDKDARLSDGALQDAANIRLVAVPKKVLPRSGRERWIAFVEKSGVSLETIKNEFLPSSDYETKTAGTRHNPAATPAAEGIYAITTTGRESHLAYIITLPSELGEVQTELGLRKRGSFIISTRNPKYEAPRGVALPKSPDYPKNVQEEFRALRWMPSQPRHLDFVNTQFLLIGESSGIAKATELQKEDEVEDRETPREELEKLEDEDTHRMEALKGNDSVAIFADLGAFAKDYPKLETTF
ncbi:hypothetical protein ONZ43_g6551 [Nemania bipapillata]|uniref:Uncharacterized protein n=1 Tax=Nemania bipapillata TaxID=110536 RepID=A0ACC2HYI5_9PEZI|nr:hypothetical protein ONZ43_g6551 [Nemania bipapillata]